MEFRTMSFQLPTLHRTVGLFVTSMVILFGIPAYADSCSRSEAATNAQLTAQATTDSTIVDVAASNPSFTTLVQAVQAAGLVETLSGDGPFTVFAPTNEAFAALPPGTLENLLKPENRETLVKILTYHVVAGAVESGDIVPGEVATVEGNPVTLAITDGRVTVNNATVVAADIAASNGVIHVIDSVILPPDL
jgi:uncharacterized surface protein with fasciclin (FAS1) repeats